MRSGGSDLIGFSSNPVRPRPIVGLRYISRDGAAALARRRQIPRQGSPALAKPALQGLIRAGFWPWSTAMACVIHWQPWLGSWGSVAARAKAAAALHGRASPACDARPPKGRYSLRTLRKGSGVLGWCSPISELDDGVMQDRRRCVRAEPLDGVRGPGCGVLLRAWDPLQSPGCCEGGTGSGRDRGLPAVKNLRRWSFSPVMRSRRRSGAAGA